jgi:DNA-binding response OmpR family regulator
MATRQRYDLAVVADMLPDVEGLEAAVQIMERSPATKTILVGPDRGPRPGLQKLGVGAYLIEPYGPIELEEALHRAFGLWRPYLFNALRASAPKSAAAR